MMKGNQDQNTAPTIRSLIASSTSDGASQVATSTSTSPVSEPEAVRQNQSTDAYTGDVALVLQHCHCGYHYLYRSLTSSK